MEKQFKVYHVPGKKIGCTEEWPQRAIDQGFNPDECEFLFTSDDGWEAGDKELELQKEYGYPVDTCHYMVSRENWLLAAVEGGRKGGLAKNPNKGTFEGRRKGGKKAGQLAVESGQFKDFASAGGKAVGKNLGKLSRSLTYAQAQEIRNLYINQNMSRKQLCIKYNVSYKVISGIVCNTTYLEE